MRPLPRILLVEDDPADAELILREVNRSLGPVEHQRGESAAELRRALREHTWDVVLSDYSMPAFSGVEALRIVRKHDRDLPFILVSGALGEEAAVAAMREGAQDYVPKDRMARLGPAIQRETREARIRREHRKAQRELAESQERYRTLFENSPTPVWVQDLSEVKAWLDEAREQGVTDFRAHFEANPQDLVRCASLVKVTAFSQETLAFFEADRAEDIPLDLSRIIEGEGWNAFREMLATLAGGARSFRGESPLRTLRGRRRRAVLWVSVARGFEENLGRAVVNLLDVTPLKEAEEALRRSQEDLNRAQEIAGMGSWEWSRGGGVTHWSRGMFRIFGLDPRAPAPDYDTFVRMLAPEDRPRMLGAVETCLTEGAPLDIEFRAFLPGGEQRHYHSLAEFLPGPPGENGTLRGITQDITEQRRLAAELNDLEKLSARGQMAAYIAHEINNPLAGIKNAFRLLEGAIPSDHPRRSYADLIKRETDRISNIVKTMYHIYRPLSQEARLVSLGEVFTDLVQLLEPRCRTNAVSIAVRLPAEDIQLHVRGDLLRQVLFNLAQNAVDASPAGGQVSLEAGLQDGRALLGVRDQGPGIPPELAASIFTAGFTTKRDTAMSGLGLGLSACRSLVETLSGELYFENNDPGPGATFRILLPLQ